MVIEHGPPAHKGVTTIMGVGDDGLPAPVRVARLVEAGAVAVALHGWYSGNRKLRNAALATLVGAVAYRLWR